MVIRGHFNRKFLLFEDTFTGLSCVGLEWDNCLFLLLAPGSVGCPFKGRVKRFHLDFMIFLHLL